MDKFINDEDFFPLLDAVGARTRRIRKEMNVEQAIPETQIKSITNDIIMAAQGVDFGSNDETVTIGDKKLDSVELAHLNKSLCKHYGDITDIMGKYLKDNDKDAFLAALGVFYNDDIETLGL